MKFLVDVRFIFFVAVGVFEQRRHSLMGFAHLDVHAVVHGAAESPPAGLETANPAPP
jgi:hypothetical protein